jgi:hypothetical protein
VPILCPILEIGISSAEGDDGDVIALRRRGYQAGPGPARANRSRSTVPITFFVNRIGAIGVYEKQR